MQGREGVRRQRARSRASPRSDCAVRFSPRSLAWLPRRFGEASAHVTAETARLARHWVGAAVGAETTFSRRIAQGPVDLCAAALARTTDIVHARVPERPTFRTLVFRDVPALFTIAEVGGAGIAVITCDLSAGRIKAASEDIPGDGANVRAYWREFALGTACRRAYQAQLYFTQARPEVFILLDDGVHRVRVAIRQSRVEPSGVDES